MKAFSNWLAYRAIKWAMRRPVVYPIHPTGEMGSMNDSYAVELIDPVTGVRFSTETVEANSLAGLVANRGQTGGLYQASIPYRNLGEYALRIVHYYRGKLITYRSPMRFMVGKVLHYSFWHVWNDRREQGKFNSQQLVRHDRMTVLSHFLKRTIADPSYGNSNIGVVTELYGTRWAEHPENGAIQSYYQLVLDSLVASGDLEKTQSIYVKLAPQALNTLTTYEEERGRHAEANRTQQAIVMLTIVLALIAAVQVGVTIWEELHPDPQAITAPAPQ